MSLATSPLRSGRPRGSLLSRAEARQPDRPARAARPRRAPPKAPPQSGLVEEAFAAQARQRHAGEIEVRWREEDDILLDGLDAALEGVHEAAAEVDHALGELRRRTLGDSRSWARRRANCRRSSGRRRRSAARRDRRPDAPAARPPEDATTHARPAAARSRVTIPCRRRSRRGRRTRRRGRRNGRRRYAAPGTSPWILRANGATRHACGITDADLVGLLA